MKDTTDDKNPGAPGDPATESLGPANRAWLEFHLLQKSAVSAEDSGWCANPRCPEELRRGQRVFCDDACREAARVAWAAAVDALRVVDPAGAKALCDEETTVVPGWVR